MDKRAVTAVAGVLIASAVFGGQSWARHQASFSIDPEPGYVNEPVTLTDTSGSSNGFHEWDCELENGDQANFQPEQTGSSATCVYSTARTYSPAQRVTEGDHVDIFSTGLTVYAQEDKPAPITLVSPSTINVPEDEIAVQTPKREVEAVAYCDAEPFPRQCPEALVRETPPNESGLRTFYFRIENASVGPATLRVFADNGCCNKPRDDAEFDLKVASSRYHPFGVVERDLFSCAPDPERPGQILAGANFSYYLDAENDPTQIKLKVLRKDRESGQMKKVKAATKSPDPRRDAPLSPFGLRDFSASIRQKVELLRRQRLYLRSTITVPGYFKSKTKTRRLKASECA